MSALDTLIQNLKEDSPSDKGSSFEALCLFFLKHDKLFISRFTDICLWHDWPHHNSHDIGIDIVAKLRNSESYCAIQCKFRNSGSITKPEIDSFLAASSKHIFSERILIVSSANFGPNAEAALENQNPPVRILTLADLEASSIDWSAYPDNIRYNIKQLMPHQQEALDHVIDSFNHHDRGKLIMACGTGKTFTSLKIAERVAGKGGNILVLVPSISLLNQTILAWNYDAGINLRSFAVCSDSTVGRRDYPDEDLRLSDLAVPPTTDAGTLVEAFTRDSESMSVIFSTYQSLNVIHDAQEQGLPPFDLVICDEAHRTAGSTPEGTRESYFRRVHDDGFIHARKRLYMTATPKIFTENLKAKAKDENILLCSMDDEDIYGPEFHRLSFSRAVEQKLLTDYKVMIFMVEKDEADAPDLPAMIQGVHKALAKDISPTDEDFLESDTSPMHRAVAFSNTIDASKKFRDEFGSFSESELTCEVRHIDGKDSAAKRSSSLHWLKADSQSCRILSNARCLCEGVDVPALDAIIFLNPKGSAIDVVQSVGRVMRKAPGKTFGYVILPVIVKPGEEPEDALDHNDSYRTVWKVLQALRANDDHFSAEIHSLELNRKPGSHVRVLGGRRSEWFTPELEERYRQEIYIRMVRKCGDREYWQSWVKDLVSAFHEISERINIAITRPSVREAFMNFTEELQAAINPSIKPEQAVEMLAQHITSKEVFDAIFSGFADYNPVSQSMQKMRLLLESEGADLDPRGLAKFNEHVREKAASAQTGEAKQKLLREIYNSFFRQAFEDTARSLGIVYTPEPIVDFIIRSADWAVREKLGITEGLSARGVNILDPFSGTGTFTARLLQLGIIPPERLSDKYMNEIHANEILLLAYYISAVNIEAAYNQAAGGIYTEFPGMVLADTFRLNEGGTPFLHRILYANGKRAHEQEDETINVIIGNPPYSVGRKSSIYQPLDERIAATYAKKSSAANKNSLYDSYIRAFRWASDRIDKKGIICFVSNGSFIDSNSADGLRKCLADEFTSIYIFNLRGNQRGGDWRKEGAKVFGEGSQCSIAITLLVKDENGKKPGGIHYHEVGDYLTREDKLEALVRCRSFGAMSESMREIEPNDAGDWVNQRGDVFGTFMCLGSKKTEGESLFGSRYSAGIKTARDAWCYNFSRESLCQNIKTLNPGALTDDSVRVGLYRPYVKEFMHFSRETNDQVYHMPQLFPKPDTKNMVMCVSGIGSKSFSVLMTDLIPGFDTLGKTQCFPLFWYEEVNSSLFGSYTERRDGISDSMLERFRSRYADGSITKEDVFCYVYGVLSSREYASRFGLDTRRVLARVPFAREFGAFRDAGRELGRLHVGYEGVESWPVELRGSSEGLRVTRMRVIDVGGERVIRVNDGLTVGGIPSDAWEYVVNGRSALEWIVERYRDDTDRKSGLRNDCNAWGAEHDDEGYIVGLIGRVTRVSVETVRILRSLPELGV